MKVSLLNVVVLVGIAILVYSLLMLPTIEKGPKDWFIENLVPNPNLTGVERPMWGRSKPLPVKDNGKNIVSYSTIHSLPWCTPLLEASGLCVGRVLEERQVNYENDKI